MRSELANRARTALRSGDVATFCECLETAAKNDALRAAVETARREAAVTEFAATPVPTSRYKVISILGRIGRRPATLYISGVSFADGPGYKVSKIRYTADKSQAHEFSTVAATGVSEYLIRCGYTPTLDAK